MKKDPACLFYIDTWLTATAEMDADVKGWYLNLILHQYDKKSLPNDIEKLAVLCNVKFSEFKRFEQVFEQVLKQKFIINEQNRLENEFAKEILQKRELFKTERSIAGKISYLMKWLAKNMTKAYTDDGFKEFAKSEINNNINDIDTKNEIEIEHLFKHLFELYINKDKDIIINKNVEVVELGEEAKPLKENLKNPTPFSADPPPLKTWDVNISFDLFWNSYNKKVGDKEKIEAKWNKLTDTQRTEIMDYIPKYIKATPEKQYRKNPETFLNNKSWNDEIITKETSQVRQTDKVFNYKKLN